MGAYFDISLDAVELEDYFAVLSIGWKIIEKLSKKDLFEKVFIGES